ncbi:Cupredoxin [Zychaea mexicana]|uniref:Cupredoxin n=1 Tax=Zychaea mexicana TaxID=64656 RepID=UPI0022FE789D|nr:Cupredoxin [Zychaea mexicana]KAI9499541.1 Cupredoxin [Zychaea mexicana]
MTHLFSFLLSVIIVTYYVATAVVYGQQTHYFEFNVTREIIDPDCSGYAGGKLLVNGQLPGPTLAVTAGDYVKILVRNLLPVSEAVQFLGLAANDGHHLGQITIHYHGIHQYGSPASDGTPFLTQDPIPPQQSYLYEFKVINQAGTYFYHAHTATYSESVFGPFIIYESVHARPRPQFRDTDKGGDVEQKLIAGPYYYDDERTIILSEWWHRTAEDLSAYVLGPNYTGIPQAPSILLNGHTLYDPTQQPVGSDCSGYSVISVDPKKTYRIRIISAAIFQTLGLAFAHHNVTIIEVDGTLVQPYDVPFLELSTAQRVSVLLRPIKTNYQQQGDYAISTVRRWIDLNTNRSSNGLAVLRYTPTTTTTTTTISSTTSQLRRQEQQTVFSVPDERFAFPPEVAYWHWPGIAPIYPVPDFVDHRTEPSRTIVLRVTTGMLPNGATRWFVNGVSFTDPKETILTTILSARTTATAASEGNNKSLLPHPDQLTENGYYSYRGTYPIKYMEVIDFVFQLTHLPNRPCTGHPWHTHGHTFWELAHGPGRYNGSNANNYYSVPHPYGRDVSLVYPLEDPAIEEEAAASSEPRECGWARVRILADNPGIWNVHCHIEPHMTAGMMIALEEAPDLLQTLYG